MVVVHDVGGICHRNVQREKGERGGERGSQPGKKFWGKAEPGNPDDVCAECHAGDIKRAERCSTLTKINK